MKKLSVLWATLWAFVNNLYVEWRNDRLENKRRRWTAYRIGGGGVVPLGKVSQDKALDKIAKFGGTVQFVDTEVAVIFYSDRT